MQWSGRLKLNSFLSKLVQEKETRVSEVRVIR